jgi:hypothetical protein
VDLLDLRPLFPFVRQGLQSELIAVLTISLVMGHFGAAVVPSFGLVLTASLVITLGTISLLLPVRGIHQCIRAEKCRKLASLRQTIRTAESAAIEGRGESDHLPGLLALEARFEAVREWPFDVSVVSRFLLYLVIPLGSWAGAALVEHAVNVLLD